LRVQRRCRAAKRPPVCGKDRTKFRADQWDQGEQASSQASDGYLQIAVARELQEFPFGLPAAGAAEIGHYPQLARARQRGQSKGHVIEQHRLCAGCRTDKAGEPTAERVSGKDHP